MSHWQCFFEVWQRKDFSACEKFFLTHSDILLWPHSIWLRVRVAQCAMALRVMVQSHVGWPWEYQKKLYMRDINKFEIDAVMAVTDTANE